MNLHEHAGSEPILGIDIGGTGIKGAPVDMKTGELLKPRHKIHTPEDSTPKAIFAVIEEMIAHFDWSGKIGCGFPGVIKHGKVLTAANLDGDWVGVNIMEKMKAFSPDGVAVINDADAAGVAEMRFGAGRAYLEKKGYAVMMVTLGTGIGTAMFIDGTLVPNLEFGHIEINGEIAESRSSTIAREREGLSWEAWAERLNVYFAKLERLCSPDVFIIGGGVSAESPMFIPLLNTAADIVVAELQNDAGIVGAALAIHHSV